MNLLKIPSRKNRDSRGVLTPEEKRLIKLITGAYGDLTGACRKPCRGVEFPSLNKELRYINIHEGGLGTYLVWEPENCAVLRGWAEEPT